MQLTLFVVIVTFAHLSCEVQSESISDTLEKLSYLKKECKDNLKTKLVERCGESPFLTQLVEVDVSKCKYRCGEEHDNGRIRGTSGQYFRLKDGTPCGQDKV
uniref:Putative thrombospondin n=1 Tax=Ixodes ricinus TaxID=34613 RepID=A0A0K8RJB8_IXORI